jgi:hypothetical protein
MMMTMIRHLMGRRDNNEKNKGKVVPDNNPIQQTAAKSQHAQIGT